MSASDTSLHVTSPVPEFVAWRRHPSSELQQHTGRFESEARVLQWFEPGLIPGLLQTRAYAHAVLDAGIGALGAGGDVSAALDARLARQQRWRASETRVHFLIAEQALYTVVGDPETTRVQLETLLGRLPGTAVVQIVPRTARFLVSATNFVVYDGTRVAVETATGTLRLCDPAAISDYLTVFDLLTQDAVLGSEAEPLIRKAIAAHR
ncbi:Scr1 family TA system antitoxin-like transcriptional regulator [Nocardia aurea]|uniref:Scr1 family TA system antitoxin-like transcriptional regulator n=1 Tax=Nocardia aurea TaxID=2144174 RepID=A0ABV3G4V8_9NOCA